MLRGTKYLVASSVAETATKIINRIKDVRNASNEEKNSIEEAMTEEKKRKEAERKEAEERESTIMCLGDGGDDNIFCE